MHKCEWLEYQPDEKDIEYLSRPECTVKEAVKYILDKKDEKKSAEDSAIPKDLEPIFARDLTSWGNNEWLKIYRGGPAAVLKAGYIARIGVMIARKNANDWKDVAGIYDRMVHAAKPEAATAARRVIRQEERLAEVILEDVIMGV